MSGSGFMQYMQNSLKSNRALLKRRRKGFFKRDLSYAEIRKYYKESTEKIPQGKGTNSIALREIRERLLKVRRRNIIVQVILFVVVASLIAYGAVSLLSDTSSTHRTYEKKREQVSMDLENDPYEKHMSLGELDLDAKEYFMAIGNYKRAMQDKPGDIRAEFGLAKAYSKSCKYRSQFCLEAAAFIQQMEEKYPNQESFTKLKTIYLSDTSH